jgi:septal ring factor EnvC (AmiA/AmiB activator)
VDKNELIIVALQQRISEIVSQYEMQVAMIRADYTELSELKKQTEKEVEKLHSDFEGQVKGFRDLISALNKKIEQYEIEVDKKSIKKAVK